MFGDLLQGPQETDTADELGFKPRTNSAPPLQTPCSPAVCLEASDSSFSDSLLACFLLGFPGGASGKGSICQCKGHGLDPLGREDPLEEEVATHSSILAWRIPGTEEPDGLQSTGPQRVGHH